MKIYDSIDALIGKTPLLHISRTEKQAGAVASVLVKAEYFNPTGSVKDRAALEMINDLEKRGVISKGATVIEPTSGNTGIGIASVCACRGYNAVIVMPDSMSEERINLMRAYGAKVVLTDGKLGMKGAIQQAELIAKSTPGAVVAGQFVNPANAQAHYKTTGPEIYGDTDGKVDIFVCGVGTGGTLTGTGEYLKEKIPNVQIVAVEPADSPVLSQGRAGAHGLQGIGAGFVPEILNTDIIDKIMTVTTEEAIASSKLLGKNEGFLVGISSGAALHAALDLARMEENKGKNIVVILPDSADRYYSTPLFYDE